MKNSSQKYIFSAKNDEIKIVTELLGRSRKCHKGRKKVPIWGILYFNPTSFLQITRKNLKLTHPETSWLFLGVTGSKSTWRIIICFLISYCCFFFTLSFDRSCRVLAIFIYIIQYTYLFNMSLKFSRLSFLWTSKASTCKLSGEFGLRPACQLQKTAVDWPCPVNLYPSPRLASIFWHVLQTAYHIYIQYTIYFVYIYIYIYIFV